jgi:cysteine desulfurase
MVSVMLANNETGAIQDILGISDCLKSRKTLLHTDAVQAIGKMPVDFNALGVDLMTLSSHKIYGPKGCGALVRDKKISLIPLVAGGGQENAIRAGTENVAGIIGFGKAAELALAQMQQNREHLIKLSNQLEAGLHTIPGLVVFSQSVERLPNTVQFGIPGTDGEMLLMQLDQKGFAVSSGSACASGGGKPSHVLLAMGIDELMAKSAIRISLGKANSRQDVERFIITLKSLISTPA